MMQQPQQQQLRRRPPGADSPVSINNTMNRPLRQSSRSMSTTASPCSGCSQPMYNPLLSNVLDRFWHPDCVRCVVCRCILNDQCYSREGKLYCKDDFIKKYIHRCFSCQNLIQSHEFIRRIRAGRIYHADCLVCLKCKTILQNDDINALMKTNNSFFNDLDYLCQSCNNPSINKSVLRTMSSSNVDEGDETTDSEISNSTNGKKASVGSKTKSSDLPVSTENSVQNNGSQPTPTKPINNDLQTTPADDDKNSNNKEQASSPSTVETNDVVPSTKSNARQSKARQTNNSNSNNKRGAAKTKGNTRQKQQPITTNERKGRPPSTRSKASNNASSSSSNVQTRSRNRRPAKTSRYRKRNFSSGSDEEDESEDEDDDDEDVDYEDEDEIVQEEREPSRSPSVKGKSSGQNNEKSKETEPVTTASTGSASISEQPHSLLGSLTPNPIAVPSLIKSDVQPNFISPNFNTSFPTSQTYPSGNHPFPPGYSLQPRMPIPPPPGVSQPSTIPLIENNSTESSTSQHDTPKPIDTDSTITTPKQPSALASLVEMSSLSVPPTASSHPPIPVPPNHPYPFPFVTPGPGIPFSPQTAAGMTTFYRAPFPIDASLTPAKPSKPSKPSKKKSKSNATNDSNEIVSQNILDEPESPKKKPRKTNGRGKGKGKKDVTEDENGPEESSSSPPPPKKRKKKVSKKATKDDDSSTTDADEGKSTSDSLNNNPSQNLLTQMGLINTNPMMPPPSTPSTSSSSSVNTPNTPLPHAHQAQIAAMYNMAPHFGPYNTFPGPFNPSFPGYPPAYSFHPAFGPAVPGGPPFPFLPPTPSMSTPSTSPPTNEKTSSTAASESRPTKARGKSKTNDEKKKTAAPRGSKKKVSPTTDVSNNDETPTTSIIPANESITKEEKISDSQAPSPSSSTTKRRISGTESEDIDEPTTESSTRVTNGKSDQESDGSINANTMANATPEKKSGRTTIKPQQLEILCKSFETCSKPNKTQREQIANETGLNIRVIQVWFQNKRSKERKGKISKEKETNADDDDAPEDSPPSSPTVPVVPTAPTVETTSIVESEVDSSAVKSDDS